MIIVTSGAEGNVRDKYFSKERGVKTKDKQRLVCSKSSKTGKEEEEEGWQGL